MNRLYHIAVFLDDNETAVPDGWLQGQDVCLWPSYKSQQRVNNAVQKNEVPGDSWKKYKVRILYTGRFLIALIFCGISSFMF